MNETTTKNAPGAGRPKMPVTKISVTVWDYQAEWLHEQHNASEIVRGSLEGEMNKNHTYYAWASNDQGASMDVARGSSINEMATEARRQLGSGWKVHIMRVDIDGDGESWMGTPTEVKTFTIR